MSEKGYEDRFRDTKFSAVGEKWVKLLLELVLPLCEFQFYL